ncbi:MAG: tRNA (adenosine(37)-N6)-dimethylallyltransferase MiaA [Candidatus Melainabacteria bacterium]|nr:tRNA (adenosine(37)-N6)-dimethylallyltransferase MiaA [Candidatus Melainabacteria bacterium]
MGYKSEHLKHILEDLQRQPRDIITIAGPTCTGKTDLSIALAQELKLPIINADSRLIFQKMNIGTAKPSQEELETVEHHMVNIKEPSEQYSAGAYREDFDQVLQQLAGKAIVVGGTGLYLRSALENLDMPDIGRDDSLRQELNQLELDELLSMLDELDPEARNDVDIKNKVRLVRAIEIVKLSGKPLSENRSKNKENRYDVVFYGLNFQRRRTLYDLINARVVRMINKGLVHEVEALIEEYGVTDTLLGTIGYKEIIGYLERQYSLSEARRMIQKKTRVYAKRQMTWFKQNREIQWLYHD